MNKLVTRFQTESKELLTQITDYLASDPRIMAAWLFGSLGRGDADEWSDIDIFVVVTDESLQDVVAQRQQFVTQIGKVLLAVEAPQNAPHGGGYLMTFYDMPIGPHQVDWYWQPQSLAYIPTKTTVLFDHVGLARRDQAIEFPKREPVKEIDENPRHFISYFWAMLLITTKYVVRQPQSEKIALLPYVLHPFHKTQRLLGQGPTVFQGSQSTGQEKLATLRYLADEMCVLMPQVAAQGSEVPDAAPTAVYKFLSLVEEALA